MTLAETVLTQSAYTGLIATYSLMMTSAAGRHAKAAIYQPLALSHGHPR